MKFSNIIYLNKRIWNPFIRNVVYSKLNKTCNFNDCFWFKPLGFEFIRLWRFSWMHRNAKNLKLYLLDFEYASNPPNSTEKVCKCIVAKAAILRTKLQEWRWIRGRFVVATRSTNSRGLMSTLRLKDTIFWPGKQSRLYHLHLFLR